MAELAISITAKLIEVLGSAAIQDVFQMWNYKSQLEELKQTVTTIQKVLLDADAKRNLSHEEEHYINNLKDVVYDADDLFDEIRTLAELKQLKSLNKVDKMIAKVRSNFSSKNPVVQAYNWSRAVKDIKLRLFSIADNHKNFGFSVDYKPIVRRREETCSYVDVNDIIGRDKDKESIIDKLLDTSGNKDVCFLSIVGVGGLGKTVLTQLVINDEKIKNEFSFRLWVSVSDQDGVQFDEKIILCKMLELVTKKKLDISSSKEVVQQQFQEKFRGKKYLLVLDDVWNEDREVLQNFRSFLELGASGSRIVITTRSKKTTINIKSEHVHNLEALSKENSRCLFEMSAFGEGEKNNELVKIGEKIIGKCHRTPLAIKVVGSLLYGQDISKWRSIENSGLGEICEGSDKILAILKLSCHNLTPSLKSCFSYSAIFPKGFRMDKEMLIGLWMAQGYIGPLDGGQSVEDAAEEYFLILMRRCFFQDIMHDEYGNVKSIKIHDLMHDVAQEVGKKEICIITSREIKLGEKIRHVNIVGDKCAKTLLCNSKIRSCICSNTSVCLVDKQVHDLTALRVLELSCLDISKILPSYFDSLLLLRYLKVSDTDLKEVPESITKLCNLETLILDCGNLRELPKDFSKLVKLRHLDLGGCHSLIGMPIGMDKLTELRVLPYFLVGGNSDNELKMLQVLTKIKGNMFIRVRNSNMEVITVKGGGYLKNIQHLTELKICFESECECANSEVVLKKLESPLNLKVLHLSNYKGTTILWSIKRCASTLRTLEIIRCENLSTLLGLEHLIALEELKLDDNPKLSICEEDEEPWKSLHHTLRKLEFSCLSEMRSLPKGMRHLTSLQSLIIEDLDNFKGGLPDWMSCFSSLQFLKIECKGIESLPKSIKDLTSLKEVSIFGSDKMKKLYENCNTEEFRTIQHIPNFKYTSLKENIRKYLKISTAAFKFIKDLQKVD